MPDNLFYIYRSSAGSGKTYRLVLDYLNLALRYPEYFRRILAVTFTNKATNEMKGRIIDNLYAIIKQTPQANDLAQTLCKNLGINEVLLREKAAYLLGSILHNYNYFSVSTIDSFFQKVVTAFARDLGIQGGYSLEFDLNKVIDDAVDHLFIDIEKDKQLLNWLIQFTEFRIEDNKSWDVRSEIKKMAGVLFSENGKEYVNQLSLITENPQLLTNTLEATIKALKVLEAELKQLGAEGLEMLHEVGLGENDFSRTTQGPGSLFRKLYQEEDFNLNSYMRNAYHDREKWFTKTSDKKDRILIALENGLHDFYVKCFDIITENRPKIYTYREVLKLYYHLGILSHLLIYVQGYRRKNDVILISDLSQLLSDIVGQNETPFIYEKIGGFFQHFLIDEFQDTSEKQWSNFKPLVSNAIAEGKENLIVGDVKQSIYRWRGGDWRILQEQAQEDIGKIYCEIRRLDINWRSKKNIILFNNLVFYLLPKSFETIFTRFIAEEEVNLSETEMEKISGRFVKAYAESRQEISSKKQQEDPGVIRITFMEDQDEAEDVVKWKDRIPGEAYKLVCELQDNGINAKDIAILVRSKDEGRKVAKYLLSRKKDFDKEGPYNLDLISSESLFLNGSQAINFLINLMKVIQNESNEIARIHLIFWKNLMLGGKMTDFENLLSTISNTETLFIYAGLESNKVVFYQSMPLNDLVEVLIQDFSLTSHSNERVFLTGFQNLVLDYGSNFNNDLFGFLEWWDQEGYKNSIKPSEEQDAIRILTIHQSKGLEYKHVIIPYCSWELDHKANMEIIWCRSNLGPLKTIPFYPVNYGKQLGKTDFSTQYFEEKSMAYMDNLNLLYVALTRAENGLYIFAPKPKKEGVINNVGVALYDLFKNIIENKYSSIDMGNCLMMNAYWNGETDVIQIGEINKSKKETQKIHEFAINEIHRHASKRKISVRKQPDFLSIDDSVRPFDKVNYGILVHEVLSNIVYKENAEAYLDKEVIAGNLPSEMKETILEILNTIWENEVVSDWFSKNWEIKTEVPVLPVSGQISRMDRLMIKGNKAIVVDYKTGWQKKGDQSQVKEYMDILEQMNFTEVEGYLLYLNNSELIQVSK